MSVEKDMDIMNHQLVKHSKRVTELLSSCRGREKVIYFLTY